MAYPMMQWPAFGDFRTRLETDFGCSYVDDGQVVLNGSRIAWLEREVDGVFRRYAVSYHPDERLAPSVVRSICAQLRVDSSHLRTDARLANRLVSLSAAGSRGLRRFSCTAPP